MLAAFEAAMVDVLNIQECYLPSGQSDYLLRVVFRDMEDLERLHSEVITRLPAVDRVQSTLSPGTVKRTTALPLSGRGAGGSGRSPEDFGACGEILAIR